jgi:hypothetical protein
MREFFTASAERLARFALSHAFSNSPLSEVTAGHYARLAARCAFNVIGRQ